MKREKPEADDRNLRGDEEHQPLEGSIHETVGVQIDAKHIDAEPGETGNDIAEHGEIHQAAVELTRGPGSGCFLIMESSHEL